MAVQAVKQTTPTNTSSSTSVQSMSVAAALSALRANPKIVVNISDTKVNIANQLPNLKNFVSNIGTLKQTGTPTDLTVKASEVFQYGGVLAKVSGFALKVSDTQTALVANLDAIQSLNALVKTVEQTGGSNPLPLTAAQALKDKEVILKLIGTKVTILDTSQNIASNCQGLTSINAMISGVQESVLPAIPVTIDATTAASCASLLGKCQGFTLEIKDTATNIGTKIEGLFSLVGKIGKIIVSDSPAPIKINATNAINYKSMIGKITNPQLSINDTSENLSKNIDKLQDLNASIVNLIAVPVGVPPQLTITKAQLDASGAVISKLSSGSMADYNYTLTVTKLSVSDLGSISDNPRITRYSITDTAENISKNFNSLQVNYNNNYVSSISHDLISIDLKDPDKSVILSVDQVRKSAGTLSKLKLPVNINDTADNIAKGISYLGASDNKIGAIIQSDPQNNIVVNADQANKFEKTLLKTNTNKLHVQDGFQALSSNLKTLKALFSKIESIDIVPVEGQVGAIKASDALVWAKATGGKFTLEDTTANISSNLDGLTKIGDSLVSITESNSSSLKTPQTLKMNMQQASQNAAVFTKFKTWYNIAITDSSINIASSIDTLIKNNSHLTSVTQAGTATPLGLTIAKNKEADIALSKMTNPYTVHQVGVSSSKTDSTTPKVQVN